MCAIRAPPEVEDEEEVPENVWLRTGGARHAAVSSHRVSARNVQGSCFHERKGHTMKVFYINNSGGGFADTLEVRDGQTIGEFFDQQMPGCGPHDYLIRVNRQPCSAGQVIQEGDRVSITPTKIEGAHRAA